jgi:hypothetical protein
MVEKTEAHSTQTKAMALAPRIGLEVTSITRDDVEGIPSTMAEDANSSKLADETSKDSRDWSPLQRIVNSSTMDIEQRSTDTERRKDWTICFVVPIELPREKTRSMTTRETMLIGTGLRSATLGNNGELTLLPQSISR